MCAPVDILDYIKARRSVRKYTDQPVEEEKLLAVLEAARFAPSASNGQSWRFVAVRDEAKRKALAEASGGQAFIAQAPVVIVACGLNPQGVMLCGQSRYTVDVSIAMAYLLLKARQAGLGTCWIGHFREEAVKKILNIPEDVRVVALTPLGYPAEFPQPTPRKKPEDIVSFDTY